jgi:hypothetical protein
MLLRHAADLDLVRPPGVARVCNIPLRIALI